jgi:hypothetical protein
MAELPDPSTFLSGEHGTVGGPRRTALRRGGDAALDAWLRVSRAARRMDELAEQRPARDVLVASLQRPGAREGDAALEELRRTRHRVRFAVGSTDAPELSGGKFPNLNVLLEGHEPADWLLVVDDDVRLPQRFLDRFIALAEHLSLDLAQPAQTLASHAAWKAVRRVPFAMARQTRFVEIGPVTAFSRTAAQELLPFPALRYGWGLDAHWAAVAAERGWKIGVLDALPVAHESREVAAGYDSAAATAEAREFLAERPFLPIARIPATVTTHRRA